MSHQAIKGSGFSVHLWWSKFSHSFQVLLAMSHTFLGDMLSQIVDLILAEFTLGQLELEIVLPEARIHNAQVM